LAEFPILSVDVEFEAPMVGDKVRTEDAFFKKIASGFSLYHRGIVDQDQVGQGVGFEKPSEPEPRESRMNPTRPLYPNNGSIIDATEPLSENVNNSV
jgi:hypothetical protein